MAAHLPTMIEDEFLTCELCLQPYQDPVYLPCLHTFCVQCLKQFTTQASEKRDRSVSSPPNMGAKVSLVPELNVETLDIRFDPEKSKIFRRPKRALSISAEDIAKDSNGYMVMHREKIERESTKRFASIRKRNSSCPNLLETVNVPVTENNTPLVAPPRANRRRKKTIDEPGNLYEPVEDAKPAKVVTKSGRPEGMGKITGWTKVKPNAPSRRSLEAMSPTGAVNAYTDIDVEVPAPALEPEPVSNSGSHIYYAADAHGKMHSVHECDIDIPDRASKWPMQMPKTNHAPQPDDTEAKNKSILREKPSLQRFPDIKVLNRESYLIPSPTDEQFEIKTKSKDNKPKKTFNCPICKQLTEVPHDGILGFPKNSFVSNLREIQVAKGTKKKKCDNCESKNAGYRCFECKQFLCSGCRDAHNWLKITKKHRVLRLESKPNLNISNKALDKIFCDKHPSEEIDAICVECGEGICSECKNSLHQQHQHGDISVASEREKQYIKSLNESLKKQMETFQKQVDKLDTYGKTLKEQRSSVLKEVNEHKDRLLKAVEECYEILTCQIEQIYEREIDRRIGITEENQNTLQKLKHVYGVSQKLLEYGKPPDVIKIGKEIKRSVTCLAQNEPTKLETSLQVRFQAADHASQGEIFSFIGHLQQRNLIGSTSNQKPNTRRVQMSSKILVPNVLFSFRSKTPNDELGCHPTGITRHADGIAIVDDINKKIKIFNSIGNIIKDISPEGPGALIDPWDITDVNGNFAVSDKGGRNVKFFSEDGEFISSFGPHLQCPWGITTNSRTDIIVTDSEARAVFVHNSHGELKFTIGGAFTDLFACPEYVTCNTKNDDIIVSDFERHCVAVFDSQGRYIFKYGEKGVAPNQFQVPCGLTTDEEGSIYICDYNNQRIHKLNENGQFLGHIAVWDANYVCRPQTLITNHAGCLVLVDGTIIKVMNMDPLDRTSKPESMEEKRRGYSIKKLRNKSRAEEPKDQIIPDKDVNKADSENLLFSTEGKVLNDIKSPDTELKDGVESSSDAAQGSYENADAENYNIQDDSDITSQSEYVQETMDTQLSNSETTDGAQTLTETLQNSYEETELESQHNVKTEPIQDSHEKVSDNLPLEKVNNETSEMTQDENNATGKHFLSNEIDNQFTEQPSYDIKRTGDLNVSGIKKLSVTDNRDSIDGNYNKEDSKEKTEEGTTETDKEDTKSKKPKRWRLSQYPQIKPKPGILNIRRKFFQSYENVPGPLPNPLKRKKKLSLETKQDNRDSDSTNSDKSVGNPSSAQVPFSDIDPLVPATQNTVVLTGDKNEQNPQSMSTVDGMQIKETVLAKPEIETYSKSEKITESREGFYSDNYVTFRESGPKITRFSRNVTSLTYDEIRETTQNNMTEKSLAATVQSNEPQTCDSKAVRRYSFPRGQVRTDSKETEV